MAALSFKSWSNHVALPSRQYRPQQSHAALLSRRHRPRQHEAVAVCSVVAPAANLLAAKQVVHWAAHASVTNRKGGLWHLVAQYQRVVLPPLHDHRVVAPHLLLAAPPCCYQREAYRRPPAERRPYSLHLLCLWLLLQRQPIPLGASLLGAAQTSTRRIAALQLCAEAVPLRRPPTLPCQR